MGVIVPVGDYQCVMTWEFEPTGKQASVVFGLHYFGAGDGPSTGSLAETVFDLVTTGDVAMCKDTNMSSQWNLLPISVSLSTGDGPIVGQSLSGVNGSGSNNSVVTNCAVLLSKNTAAGGRKNKGRFFFPPFVNGLSVSNTGAIQSSSADLILVTVGNMLDDLDDIDIAMVIHHSDGSTGTRVTGVTLQSLVATQRRRLR